MLQGSYQETGASGFSSAGTEIRVNFIQRRLAAGKSKRLLKEENEKSEGGKFVTIRPTTAFLKFDTLKQPYIND
jgi:hypothetical protein